MAEKQPAPRPRPGDFQPLTEFERRMRDRIMSQDLPGVPAEFMQHIRSQLELQPPATIASSLSGLPAAINDLLPWLIDIDVYMTAGAKTNWDTLTIDTSSVFNFRKESSGAQNDEIAWDVLIPAGTWTFELMHMKDTNRGIYTVYFDTTAVGTIDGYSGIASRNQRTSIGSIVRSSQEVVTLKLKMETKNASSSNYYGSIQAIQLRRTA